MSFAERLQNLREYNEISRKELASFLNISVSAIGMYERGAREPNIDILIKLANYFNVSLDFLLGREFHNNETKEILDALYFKKQITKLPIE